MCWNSEVSLNTFLFSSFVLLLIIYNNSFTKYKIEELHNIWINLFFASFISIQLIEFFIWRNIHNKFYNNLFSICAFILILLQPFFSLMILSDILLRNILLICYSILVFLIFIFSTNKHIYSEVSKSGHLRWRMNDSHPIFWLGWLFFFSFSLFYEKRKWYLLFFSCITVFIAFINFKNDDSVSSMWCWGINSLMIYFAFYLLIYLPFTEKNKIC